ncbi:GntR family transcriptional regulator [Arthrobacter ginkgonis]|uniref:GntR family transcriptional regulator n=1 Tax=Arthrobacter ginkgonis TaxID=1630594 RepID=A0ABP7C1M7_9MICC
MGMQVELPQSRIDAVLGAIRHGILTSELLPGQPLVEAELAQRLGVSKTPVREALKILSNSGLVQFAPYKGARVQEVDRTLTLAVRDLRLLLEPEAVRRTVALGAGHYWDRAAEILERAHGLLETNDRATLSLLNRDFHASLYAGCGNPLLLEVLDNLRDRTALISVFGWRAAGNDDEVPAYRREWLEHQEILDAARAGQADVAADLSEKHMTRFFERILAILPDG